MTTCVCTCTLDRYMYTTRVKQYHTHTLTHTHLPTCSVYHWGCRFVGLEQTKEEQLVWEAIQDCMTVPESVDQTGN